MSMTLIKSPTYAFPITEGRNARKTIPSIANTCDRIYDVLIPILSTKNTESASTDSCTAKFMVIRNVICARDRPYSPLSVTKRRGRKLTTMASVK